jgi:capsular polysaccharide biosynthesis protein
MSATAHGLEPILAAATRGDAAEATRAARRLMQANPPPRIVQQVLDAAINLDDAGFIDIAAGLAIAAPLQPAGRIHAAWRLAIAGFADQAMAVLLCDQRVLAEAGSLEQVLEVLRTVQLRAGPGSLTRAQASALSRRLLPLENPPMLPSERGFAGDPRATPVLRGAPVTIQAAPGAPAVVTEELRGVLAEFERSVVQIRHPTVSIQPDMFVNRLGQLWGRDGRLFRTYGRAIPDASRQAEATAPVLDEATLAVERHNNVFHWFAEWFPTLAWRLDDPACTMPVLVRDDAASFVTESLHLGAASPLSLAGAGDAIFIRRLYVAQRDLAMLAREEAVGALMTRLRERALAQFGALAGTRPVYISRRDSRKRRMANELELEAALEARGFDIVQMTPLSFGEKVARISRAPLIVGAHGAGLAVLAAACPGRQVLEIIPALRGGMQIRTVMAKISRIVGHSHHVWLQDVPAVADGWSLSLEPFLALLDSLPATATAPT